MADFRLRIGFAKTGSALWLSHLELVRAMERCVRRSGLPYAISHGFSPHMKHSFSSALPVGTGSAGEYMDVEMQILVEPGQALQALQAAQHEDLPVLSAAYIPKDEPSLQVALNLTTYEVVFRDADGTRAPELLRRLQTSREVEILKKGRPKTYILSLYLIAAEQKSDGEKGILCITLLSRPEGSLRPEILLQALAEPDCVLDITAITRIALEQQPLG